MMYEDLIKKLHEYSNARKGEIAEITKEAADAIEELRGLFYLMKSNADWLSEKIPKWIPATERLPEEPYGCLAVVWDNPRYGGGDMFLNYYPEFIGWDGERWNDADGEEIPLDVVYWMRLPQIPEPPKEE